MDIHQHVQILLAKEAADEAEADRVNQEREAQKQIELREAWVAFYAEIDPLVPDLVRGYMVRNGEGYLGEYLHVGFDVPDLAPFSICFRKFNGGWIIKPGQGTYRVETYELNHPYYDSDVVSAVQLDRIIEFGDFDQAVLAAYNSAVQCEQLRQQAEANNAEFQRRKEKDVLLAEMRAEREQAEEVEQAEIKLSQAREIDRVFEAVKADPIGRNLIMIWKAIIDERREWQERLAAMEEGSESTEMYYERKLREAREMAESAKREARDERQRASDAEDERDSLKKKQRRGM